MEHIQAVESLDTGDALCSLTWKLASSMLAMAEAQPSPGHKERAAAFLTEVGLELLACADLLADSGEDAFDVVRRQLHARLRDRAVSRAVSQANEDVEIERSQPRFRLVETPERCPKCESALVLKRGRFGMFYGCSSYPECKISVRASLGVACPVPECKGQLVEKCREDILDGLRGYVGCSEYKSKGKGCQFVEWTPPERIPCHRCGVPFVLNEHGRRRCIDPACISEEAGEGQYEDDRITRLFQYAVRLAPPGTERATILARASGLLCGMQNAPSESSLQVFVDAFRRGHAWYEHNHHLPSYARND